MTSPMPKTITISIGETVRHKEWENIKPEVSAEFNVPEDCDNLDQYYNECYKVLKKVFNLHLYNMLFNTQERKKSDSLINFITELITGKEKFPKFKFKEK
jgi:hypothetical protein